MRYETSVEIAAPPEMVWAVLADVERWPEWTESMTSVRRLDDGELRVGSEARIAQPRLRPATWRVTDLEAGSHFTWESRAPGVRSVAGHSVVRLGERRSRVSLTLDQTGPTATLVRAFAAGLVRRYLAVEAAGLERRCTT